MQIGEIVVHIGCGYGCIFVHIGVELELTIRSASEKLGWRQNSHSAEGAIPNFATEKEQKRNFLDFTDVTLVVVDIKSERFVKSTCLQQDLFDMTMVTIMFDTKSSESETFIDGSIEGITNLMMEFHHF